MGNQLILDHSEGVLALGADMDLGCSARFKSLPSGVSDKALRFPGLIATRNLAFVPFISGHFAIP